MDLSRVMEIGTKLVELRIGILQRNLELAATISKAIQQNMADRVSAYESLTSTTAATTAAATTKTGSTGTTGAASTGQTKFQELLLERMAQNVAPKAASRTDLVALFERTQADEALKRAS